MDERLGTPPAASDSVVVRLNLRPDEPDVSARLDDSGSWGVRAIARARRANGSFIDGSLSRLPVRRTRVGNVHAGACNRNRNR
jgi:hypothetical protein